MNRKLIALCCFLLLTLSLAAQVAEKPQPAAGTGHWYIGMRGGVPFGVSTFTSFGAHKTRAGLAGGVYGGYRFNPILSLEASAAWGKTGLSADEGCTGYWLGADGNRYLVPVAGMEGWNYSDIYSSVAIQQHGLHLNINVLGFFAATRDSRWTMNLSPALYGVGTKATIKTSDGNQTALKGADLWHLGVGGDLMAAYAITENLTGGIYTGITYLTGEKMDGMPQYVHKNKMIWESGIRIGWRFGKQGKKAAGVTPVVTSTTPTWRETPKKDAVQVIKEDKVETLIDTATVEKSCITFPTIYFAFNSTTISGEELPKLHQILDLLRANPAVTVMITGWCDKQGTEVVNARISRQRALAVKTWLTRQGIAASRLTATGKGIDTRESDAAKARRTETTTHKNEK